MDAVGNMDLSPRGVFFDVLMGRQGHGGTRHDAQEDRAGKAQRVDPLLRFTHEWSVPGKNAASGLTSRRRRHGR
jgi:hypothetical protein